MGTHSTIIQKQGQKYRGIYCHWDGYPAHVGNVLVNFYDTYNLVRSLIALQSLSTLGSRLAPDEGEEHWFMNAAKGVTVAHRRDRGEGTEIPSKCGETPEVVANGFNYAYAYLFQGGKWHVKVGNDWIDLRTYLDSRNLWKSHGFIWEEEKRDFKQRQEWKARSNKS